MSTTYPRLTETVFPDAVDSLTRMADITASDLTHVNQYYTYYNAGNMEAAAQVISTYGLDSKLFNAAKFNKLIDALVAVEKFFLDDAFNNRGAWSSSTAYLPGDSVYDATYGNGYVCRKANTNHRPLEDESDEYWGLIALRGQRGPAGANATVYEEDPEMDGVASQGVADNWARGDHVHPSDTSRAAAVHQHSGSDITSGVVDASHGGTGKSSAVGSATKPVYLGNSGITACTYSLEKSVPSNAVFTDTTDLSDMTGTLPVSHGGTGKTSAVGSGTRPVYLSSSGVAQCTYSLNKTVPSDAVFTDTKALSEMTGKLPVNLGGTNGTTAAEARTNLGVLSGASLPNTAENGTIFLVYGA